MTDRRVPSSADVGTVGDVLTLLPLYCDPCRHEFEGMVAGVVLRVKGQLVFLDGAGPGTLVGLVCPRCGRGGLRLREVLP